MDHTRPTKLFIMIAISFVVMFFLMYMMVDVFSNIYINLDQFYMALLMTSAMVIIEMTIMSSMYGNRTKVISIIFAVIIFITSFLCMRRQTGISDREFLKAMISHHGAAVLMCEKANLQDEEVQKLCSDIISSQQSQIDWMKMKLQEQK